MFQTNAYGNPFRLDGDAMRCQPPVNIARGVPRCQNDRTRERLSRVRLDAFHLSVFNNQNIHPGLEMHFAPARENRSAHILNHARQLVRTDVRVSVRKYRCGCPMLAEHVQDFVRVSPFFAAGIELPVGVGARPSLSETVIRFGVYDMFTVDLRKVFLPLAYILSAFYDNGAQTEFDKAQGCEQPARTGTHYDNLWLSFYVGVVRMRVFIVLRNFANVRPYLQVDEHGALPRVDAPLQYPDGSHLVQSDSFLFRQIFFQSLLVGGRFGENAQLVFLYHKIRLSAGFVRVYPNSALNASSTFLTGTSSIFSFWVFIPCRLYLGSRNCLKPSFSASPMRCSMRFTGRISPESPISPAMQISRSTGASMFDDKIALMTAKSMAGSFTFSPPAMLRNTSFCASLDRKSTRLNSSHAN